MTLGFQIPCCWLNCLYHTSERSLQFEPKELGTSAVVVGCLQKGSGCACCLSQTRNAPPALSQCPPPIWGAPDAPAAFIASALAASGCHTEFGWQVTGTEIRADRVVAPVPAGRGGMGVPLLSPPCPTVPTPPAPSLPCQSQAPHSIPAPALRGWDSTLPPIHLFFLGPVPTAHDFRNANGPACRFSGRCQGRRGREKERDALILSKSVFLPRGGWKAATQSQEDDSI